MLNVLLVLLVGLGVLVDLVLSISPFAVLLGLGALLDLVLPASLWVGWVGVGALLSSLESSLLFFELGVGLACLLTCSLSNTGAGLKLLLSFIFMLVDGLTAFELIILSLL